MDKLFAFVMVTFLGLSACTNPFSYEPKYGDRVVITAGFYRECQGFAERQFTETGKYGIVVQCRVGYAVSEPMPVIVPEGDFELFSGSARAQAGEEDSE